MLPIQKSKQMQEVIEGRDETFKLIPVGTIKFQGGTNIGIRKSSDKGLEKEYLKKSRRLLDKLEDMVNAEIDQEEYIDAYLKAANDDLKKAYENRQKAIREEEAAGRALEQAKQKKNKQKWIMKRFIIHFHMEAGLNLHRKIL